MSDKARHNNNNNNNNIHLYSADSILICSSALYNSIKVGVCYACTYVCVCMRMSTKYYATKYYAQKDTKKNKLFILGKKSVKLLTTDKT